MVVVLLSVNHSNKNLRDRDGLFSRPWSPGSNESTGIYELESHALIGLKKCIDSNNVEFLHKCEAIDVPQEKLRS